MITIYFTDHALKFVPTDYLVGSDERLIAQSELSRAKIINFFDSCNTLVVADDNYEALFNDFATQFEAVEAAGGVVENEFGQVLMILRQGRWDLPKGRIEAGEDSATAALREVEEETGAANLKIVRHLCNTLHAYCVYGKWELKRTYWYAMQGTKTLLRPQLEEDIVDAVWCDSALLAQNLNSTFATIREVIYEYSCKNTLG